MIARRSRPPVVGGAVVGVALVGVVLLVAAGVLWSGRTPAVTASGIGQVPAGSAVAVQDLRAGSPGLSPGTVPVRLDLPARAASAPVVPVGTGRDGALVIPDPPRTVGWWEPGALAGSGTGTVVVAGHVDSREAGVGILAVVPQLTVGETVVLTGDRPVTYRVVARREFGKAELPADTFARTGAPRLVLITCGGRFDPATRSYEDNIVVYAVPG